MRSLILGTAGHIDHGKTSLVKALTGTDTDRLPEEKARGISIDLGFAALDLGGVRLGVVDVPGHERFIRNMLAGATGIDLALLVVAADDGVMPQTREHADILNFLGVSRGVVAVTKADLATDEQLELVTEEIRELLGGTLLKDAPIIPTSVTTGLGLLPLQNALQTAIRDADVPAAELPFHLAIDRVFVRQGHGTVVTGTVRSGCLKGGDEIEWHRGGETERVRVRGLARHGEPVEAVERGQRAAINLAGVNHEGVHRRQELAAIGYLQPSRLLTVKLRVSRDGRPLRHRLPVRVHLGTAEVMGTLTLLDADTVAPGETCFAQLFLEEPVTAVWGQPVVLRDSGAETTLAGGPVLQPVAGKLKRRDAESLRRLSELLDVPSVRLPAAAWFAGNAGLDRRAIPQQAGVAEADGPAVHLHPDRLVELRRIVVKTLAALHAAHPLMTNHDRPQLVATLHHTANTSLLNIVIDGMLTDRQLVGDAKRIALATFKPKLSAAQQKLKERIVEAHRVAGFAPPEPASFANLAMGNKAALADIYDVAVAEGSLAKVSAEIFLHAEAVERLKATLKEKMPATGATVAAIRDWLGTTRKYAVPLCEWLDKSGITERRGDLRLLK